MTAIPEDVRERDERLTQEELFGMFPDGIPMEVVAYLWSDPAKEQTMAQVRAEVSRMARELEARVATPEGAKHKARQTATALSIHHSDEGRIAILEALILSEREAAQREERERCAKIVERYQSFPPPTSRAARYHLQHCVKPNIAAAILQEPKE